MSENTVLSGPLTQPVLGCFELHMTGGGGGGWDSFPLRSQSQRGRWPQNLARTSEIAQRKRPQCYFSQTLHILLAMIMYGTSFC